MHSLASVVTVNRAAGMCHFKYFTTEYRLLGGDTGPENSDTRLAQAHRVLHFCAIGELQKLLPGHCSQTVRDHCFSRINNE